MEYQCSERRATRLSAQRGVTQQEVGATAALFLPATQLKARVGLSLSRHNGSRARCGVSGRNGERYSMLSWRLIAGGRNLCGFGTEFRIPQFVCQSVPYFIRVFQSNVAVMGMVIRYRPNLRTPIGDSGLPTAIIDHVFRRVTGENTRFALTSPTECSQSGRCARSAISVLRAMVALLLAHPCRRVHASPPHPCISQYCIALTTAIPSR